MGLGDIKVTSAINTPFQATVPLLSMGDVPLDQIQVNLASRRAYHQLGVPLPNIADQLHFEVTRTHSGNPVIIISSKLPVTYPYIELLLNLH